MKYSQTHHAVVSSLRAKHREAVMKSIVQPSGGQVLGLRYNLLTIADMIFVNTL